MARYYATVRKEQPQGSPLKTRKTNTQYPAKHCVQHSEVAEIRYMSRSEMILAYQPHLVCRIWARWMDRALSCTWVNSRLTSGSSRLRPSPLLGNLSLHIASKIRHPTESHQQAGARRMGSVRVIVWTPLLCMMRTRSWRFTRCAAITTGVPPSMLVSLRAG